MLIRVNNDGTYCANWTPGAIGLYTIHVTIDGIEIGIFQFFSCYDILHTAILQSAPHDISISLREISSPL